MRVMDVVNQTKAAMRASEVFGTPYEKNGVTIIPAARIAAEPVAAAISRSRRQAVWVSASRPARSAPL